MKMQIWKKELNVDGFALKVALVNAIGSAVALGGPTLIDPRYENVYYGPREYPLGFWVLLMTIPIFLLTYKSNPHDGLTLKKRASYTLLSIIIPT